MRVRSFSTVLKKSLITVQRTVRCDKFENFVKISFQLFLPIRKNSLPFTGGCRFWMEIHTLSWGDGQKLVRSGRGLHCHEWIERPWSPVQRVWGKHGNGNDWVERRREYWVLSGREKLAPFQRRKAWRWPRQMQKNVPGDKSSLLEGPTRCTNMDVRQLQ